MKIEKISIDNIEANPWNPNEVAEDVLNHLKKEYERVGYLQPILVRPINKENHKQYQIIDGEHRWKVAKEAGIKEIEAVVVELDDTQAKLTTINMNRIKGADNPFKLADLIKDLNTALDMKEISVITNIPEAELSSILNISEFPEIDLNEINNEKVKYVICPHCNNKLNLKELEIIEE